MSVIQMQKRQKCAICDEQAKTGSDVCAACADVAMYYVRLENCWEREHQKTRGWTLLGMGIMLASACFVIAAIVKVWAR